MLGWQADGNPDGHVTIYPTEDMLFSAFIKLVKYLLWKPPNSHKYAAANERRRGGHPMTQEDALAAAWDGYRAALAQLEAAEQLVAQADRDSVVGLLRRELNALGRGEHEALKFVDARMSSDAALTADLFPDLMRRAGPTWRWVRNRRLLLRIAPDKLKALVTARVAAVMADQDGEYDYGDYWGLLDLMYHARWDDMMEPLIQAALESEDEDIYHSGMDWKKTLERGGGICSKRRPAGQFGSAVAVTPQAGRSFCRVKQRRDAACAGRVREAQHRCEHWALLTCAICLTVAAVIALRASNTGGEAVTAEELQADAESLYETV